MNQSIAFTTVSRLVTHTISASLLGLGVTAWAFAGRRLVEDADLKVPLNPFGINGSPYGEVFAMAIQGPIDTYFHNASSSGVHHHEDGEDCDICHKIESFKPDQSAHRATLKARFAQLLTALDEAVEARTNPKAASNTLQFYLRRQVEDKLRFGYQLDPTHYANYNSLHFFLIQSQLGTRPELTPSAAKLADETVRYCLKQDQDPRPALTAASAMTNVLELMFNDHQAGFGRFSIAQMHQQLSLLDLCLTRYVTISQKWDQSKNWDLLSPMRIVECNERLHFIRKIRETAAATINRLEWEAQESQVTN